MLKKNIIHSQIKRISLSYAEALSVKINGNSISDPVTFNDLSSDHLPISFQIPINSLSNPNRKILNLRKANWKIFRNILSYKTDELNDKFQVLDTPEKVDSCIESFSEEVNAAVEKAIPKKNPYRFRYPYDDELRTLTKNRNHYRNLYKSSLNPAFKSIVNQLNRLIHRKTAKLNCESFERTLANLNIYDNSFYQFSKALKSKKSEMPPLVDNNGSLAYSDSAKARALADNFLKSHNLTHSNTSKYDALVGEKLTELRRNRSHCMCFSTHSLPASCRLQELSSAIGEAQARSVVSSLYCLFRKNNSVSFHAKLTAYKTLIRPIMTYACPIFSNCPDVHFKRLQIQQNKLLRMVLNAPFFTRTTDLHKEANDIPTIRQFVDKLTKQFYSRASSHENKLVKNLGNYDIRNMGFRIRIKFTL
ncbi:CLUMA_CG004194, isoform A [Clunio marinus]|uniref:CLUMA_CG004194, isoform A n=1 Tax=Clunio marinus TaxID=568069 RepID=A0A1J1HSP2_9DIPT|nr:CLUMA_CG004194, isoform A [Clunio marinus]